jgi:hypothetical protein
MVVVLGPISFSRFPSIAFLVFLLPFTSTRTRFSACFDLFPSCFFSVLLDSILGHQQVPLRARRRDHEPRPKERPRAVPQLDSDSFAAGLAEWGRQDSHVSWWLVDVVGS